MHKLLPAQRAPRFWSPRLRPWLVRLLRPVRQFAQRRMEQIHAIDIAGESHLEGALRDGHGVLLTPNHYCYSDPYVLAHAADRVGRPFYYMAAWQTMGLQSWPQQMVMRWHGSFSVDRDAPDRQAFKTGIDLLETSRHPLVVFAEGDIFRVSDRLFPFREGCAAMALAAAKKAQRKIVAVPCALRYEYLDDVSAQFDTAVETLERKLFLRPQPGQPLVERIYRIAAGALTLKELDFLSHTRHGDLAERVEHLGDAVLRQIAERHHAKHEDAPLVERIKTLRQKLVAAMETSPDSRLSLRESSAPSHSEGENAATFAERKATLRRDLDDLFFVEQLACYPLPYISEHSGAHRLAETLDKLEEDLLGLVMAKPRGRRHATLTFDTPLVVDPSAHDRTSLTQALQARVQALLDASSPASPPRPSSPPIAPLAGTPA